MASSTDRPASAALTTAARRLRRALPGRTAPEREPAIEPAVEPAVEETPAETPTAPSPPTKRPAPQGYGPAGIPGRMIRVVPQPGPVGSRMELEVADPSEAAAVRAGWQLVDAYERLSVSAARQVFGREVDAWRAYADDTIVQLVHAVDDEWTESRESVNNRLRYRRMMDFARAGDRVFDVGFGKGSLAAQLIKGTGVAAYHGIDIVDSYVPEAIELFAANDLADAPITLEKGDLYDLTGDKPELADATLVICCEVLEHVPDPELALRTLADALPEGADLIFSVPLIGRLEGVWGHVTVFGISRLKDMLEGAGLYAHHVEPLSNVWALVVASRDPGPSRRVREAGGRPRTRVEAPLTTHHDFVDVASESVVPAPDSTGSVTVEPAGEARVTCRFTASGGVRFPAEGLESLRLALYFGECRGVEQIHVTASAGGTRTCRWTWTPRDGQLKDWIAVKVRPGEADTRFISGPHKNVAATDEIEVSVVLAEGGTATFDLRASLLP
ncbi:class I SAM-dependent methyltransferase [Nocardioides plantarum]|uniref:Methyltransferase domain-containing protein n=1 Tax=Nocardioides plantarum TaxID=29299 RepID=A0ABV5KC59_9ACTN|nr:class I SAM-dependent methyltransferase [Nocardioides plantarum]